MWHEVGCVFKGKGVSKRSCRAIVHEKKIKEKAACEENLKYDSCGWLNMKNAVLQ